MTEENLEEIVLEYEGEENFTAEDWKKLIVQERLKLKDAVQTRDKAKAKLRTLEKGELEQLNDVRIENESLRKQALEGQIIRAATAKKAINPTQIAAILLHDFSYDSENRTFYKPQFENGKMIGKASVDDFVSAFLERDDNANLVHAGMRSGTGESDIERSPSSLSKKYGKSHSLSKEVDVKLTSWAKEREMTKDNAIDLYKQHGEKLFKY